MERIPFHRPADAREMTGPALFLGSSEASYVTGATLVAVTNEVGLGVVPEYPLARLYRDQLGWANQRLARAAGSVYFLVSGFPLDVKALAAQFPAAPPFPIKESDQ